LKQKRDSQLKRLRHQERSCGRFIASYREQVAGDYMHEEEEEEWKAFEGLS
jgi:hypothetical protein